MFIGMFLRSFFIQAGWNFERFQNLGFAFMLEPALRRIYPEPEKFKAALLRHLAIFNTQPYMASFVAGNVASMEEKAAASADPDTALKALPGVKQALASSFASIGDRIFWGRLKPLTLQLCVLVWSAGGFYGWLFTGREESVSTALLLAGPLSGIACYSAFAVYWRWRGLKVGYDCGGSSSCGLACADWSRTIRLLSTTGFAMSLVIVLLAFSMLAAFNSGVLGETEMLLKAGLPLGAMALHRACRARGRSIFFAAGLVLAVSVLLYAIPAMEPFKLYL